MKYVLPADEGQQEPEDAASSKENRQQNSNANTSAAEAEQSGRSAKTSRGTCSTSNAVASKVRKSARLSGSSTSSATLDSAGPQEPAPQGWSTLNSAAQTAPAQFLDTQHAANLQEAAGTPVKAQQAKPADDLDKLLGSRLKSVRPQAELRQSEEAAASPVAALRGQLKRVKLEPEEASSPTARPGFGRVAGGGCDSPAQVNHAATVHSAWY